MAKLVSLCGLKQSIQDHILTTPEYKQLRCVIIMLTGCVTFIVLEKKIKTRKKEQQCHLFALLCFVMWVLLKIVNPLSLGSIDIHL